MWLKEFTGSGEEILQFEVTWSFERESETLRRPLPAPQHVFTEAARSSADVGEIQQLIWANQRALWAADVRQGHKAVSYHSYMHMHTCHMSAYVKSVGCIMKKRKKAQTPFLSFGCVNMKSSRESMLAIFIAALQQNSTYYSNSMAWQHCYYYIATG